jgi:hypothetical protein
MMRVEDLDELARDIMGDAQHTKNSFSLRDPQLSVLLDGLLELGLLDGDKLALNPKLYKDPAEYESANRMNLLGYAAIWARDRVSKT